ncbi:COG1361 S-layer family protein [Candidatus Woesearchaeota archaeon]|nr:COG1361 S-layer family protein [Candidatus Woesearchaeota archaeon]
MRKNAYQNKKISRLSGFVILALIALALAASVSAETTTLPQIKVTLINQEPDPVAPGNTVDVRFRIENEGGAAAQNVDIKIVPDYPFSIYGSESDVKNIGTLTGYQTGDVGVNEKWNLLVDSNAATGDNPVEFWYRTNNGNWIKSGEYDISIQSREAVLAINQIKTEPESIVPGTKTKVSFVLENLADNTLRDIKLNLDIYTELATASSVTFRELPFTPIGSGNEKTLKLLMPGQSAEISFDIFTDADADSKVYKVPYALTYYDSSGTDFEKEGIVGFIVESEPDISVNIESTEIYQAGVKGNVEIKIVNKGFSDIKFLDVNLMEGENYEILSNPEVYIGKLDSDDYETAGYTILVDGDAGDKVTLPLKIEYRDANGHLFTQEMPLELPLFSGAELKQRTNGKSSPFTAILIVAILAIIGIVIYRKIKKGKKKKE